MKQTRKIGRDCCNSSHVDFVDHLDQIPGSADYGHESVRQTSLEWDLQKSGVDREEQLLRNDV